MRGSRWEKVSREAKDLISKLLIKNPKNRLDAEQALAHKWFRKATTTKIIEVDPNIINSLRSFRAKTKL